MKNKELLKEEELNKVTGGAELRNPVNSNAPRPSPDGNGSFLAKTRNTKEYDEQILDTEFPSPKIGG